MRASWPKVYSQVLRGSCPAPPPPEWDYVEPDPACVVLAPELSDVLPALRRRRATLKELLGSGIAVRSPDGLRLNPILLASFEDTILLRALQLPVAPFTGMDRVGLPWLGDLLCIVGGSSKGPVHATPTCHTGLEVDTMGMTNPNPGEGIYEVILVAGSAARLIPNLPEDFISVARQRYEELAGALVWGPMFESAMASRNPQRRALRLQLAHNARMLHQAYPSMHATLDRENEAGAAPANGFWPEESWAQFAALLVAEERYLRLVRQAERLVHLDCQLAATKRSRQDSGGG